MNNYKDTLDELVQQMLLDYTDWVNGKPVAWNVKKAEGLEKLNRLIEDAERAARLEEQQRTGSVRYKPDQDGNYGDLYFYNYDGSTVKTQAERITELSQPKEGGISSSKAG